MIQSPGAAPQFARNGAVLGLVLVVIIFLLAGAPGAPANANEGAVLQVTKRADTADGTCDSDCSLREAVIAANADENENTINVPGNPANYQITLGFGDDAGLQGDFDIATTVTIQGAGSDQTIVDGDAADTVFDVHDDGQLTLRDLTVRNGKAIALLGGGIFAEGDLTLDRVIVSENEGPDFGAGGVYATARVSMEDSEIKMNAGGNEGVGGLFTDQEAELEGSTISDNTASGTSSVGGARLEWNADLVDMTISGNVASGENSAGGLFTTFGEKAELRRVTISGNSAGGNFAVGGWWNRTPVTAENIVLEGNQGGLHGTGGLYIECCGTFDLERAAVTGNTAGDDGGGGIWNDSEATVTNVTVSGNSAGAAGAGGLYNAGDLELVSTTIAENTAGADGADGLWNDAGATVHNTIVASGGTECINNDTVTSEGGNFSSQAGCGFSQASDHPNADAMLDPLADNGGFSQTRALLAGSPAIDAGFDCPPPETDQRGVERPEGACDSGAYEVGEFVAFHGKWGDIRCDGVVAPEDVTALLNAGDENAAHVSTVCPDPLDHVSVIGFFDDHSWADLNCDEDVNGLDALFLLKSIALLEVVPSSEPCPAIGQSISLE